MGLKNLLPIALVLLALAGCRSPGPTAQTAPSAPSAPEAQTDLTPERPKKTYARVTGIQRLEIPIPGVLLVKPDHYMGSYDQLMVDPIILTLGRKAPKLSAAEIRRLETHLRDATARELVNVDPLNIVDRPGRCVLRMQTAFLDLEMPKVETSGSHSTIVDSFGSVTLVHELRDSMTGTVLLRYMGRGRAPGGRPVGWAAPWSGLRRTFDRLLGDLQQTLVETVPLSTATTGPLARCSGLIYKKIEEG